MASHLTATAGGLRDSSVDIEVVDWDEIDELAWRDRLFSPSEHAIKQVDVSSSAAPRWQCLEDDFWDWKPSLLGREHSLAELGCQAERLWGHWSTPGNKENYGAVFCLLDWVPRMMPVFSAIVTVCLLDSDEVEKNLVLLVEPAGSPRQWTSCRIKRLRRCIWKQCYGMAMVDMQCAEFLDTDFLQRVILSILDKVPLREPDLSKMWVGKLSDLRPR